jgi:predicted ribosomally synthesized peptide with nif11-like leader
VYNVRVPPVLALDSARGLNSLDAGDRCCQHGQKFDEHGAGERTKGEQTMSTKAVLAFVDQINESDELQARCKEVVEGSEDPRELVAMGKEHGHEFTVAEVVSFFKELAEDSELSDDELEEVAGGVRRAQRRLFVRSLRVPTGWRMARLAGAMHDASPQF